MVDKVVEQLGLNLNRPQPAPGAKCAHCGREFTAPSQYRYRGADGKPVCRDLRGCRARSGK